ncbi:MAG: formyltransferase family protein [Candidatus Omnitrophota bacterium]
MKLIVLTSDTFDGRVVCQELAARGMDLKAVIYEEKKKTAKTIIRFMLLYLIGKLRYLRFENIRSDIKGVKVVNTRDINDDENIEIIKSIKPDLIVVVGTRKLKKEVFAAARYGAINMHAGILPFYRGADSEFWALYNNERDMLGVTVHFIDEGLDAGNVILDQKREVTPGDTYNSLRKKNIWLGAEKICEAIMKIEMNAANSRKQDINLARMYRSCSEEEKAKLKERTRQWIDRRPAVKKFGDAPLVMSEEVAERPMVEYLSGQEMFFPKKFCLRIDADEYHPDLFDEYIPLFREYSRAITVFINANSFSGAKRKILELNDMGVDIQSHGYYHHTYSDYASNRYNIGKAKKFFKDIGLETRGFAAPMGRWNRSLIRALEDEGYEYSSDFSYDYLGYPSYPGMGGRLSSVLEIPVFPVAPEPFFHGKRGNKAAILEYYKAAIDEMIRCGIPVIVYAHTSDIAGVPELIEGILGYATVEKELGMMNMTDFNDYWRIRAEDPYRMPIEKRTVLIPDDRFLGRTVDLSLYRILKENIKRAIDLEDITPNGELRCLIPKRCLKVLVRNALNIVKKNNIRGEKMI